MIIMDDKKKVLHEDHDEMLKGCPYYKRATLINVRIK